MTAPEAEPERQHLVLCGGYLVKQDRYLRHGGEHGHHLICDRLGGVGVVPHKHIGMHRYVAEYIAHIHRLGAVAHRIVGAVADAEHIAVFAYRGTVVGLAEFNEDLRVYSAERRRSLGKQAVNAFFERFGVAARIGGRGLFFQ